MRETISYAQEGFCIHNKFVSKFSRDSLTGISDQSTPDNEHLAFLDSSAKVGPEYPPPPSPEKENLAFFGQFAKVVPKYPPPPQPKMKT